MNSGPVSSSPAPGSASSSTSGPTIGVPERKYIPYRQGAEEQLKLTVGNRAGRAPKAPTTAPVMSSSVALVETLLAPEPGLERASSPRYCSALRERCVSLSDGIVTVTPTKARGGSIITWQHQDGRKKRPGVGSLAISPAPYKKGHRRSPATAAADWGEGKKRWKRSRNPRSKLLLTSGKWKWKENLDHLLEVEVEIEVEADTADAAGTQGTTGTNATIPLLVAQVPQSAPAAAVVPGAVPSPTSGTSLSSWTLSKTGKEEGNKPFLPSKPPLRPLPLAKRNSNARPGQDNNDVNRNNKWEGVPGSDGDSRRWGLGSKPASSGSCWSSTCSTSPSLLPPLPPLSSPASRPGLQLQACISPRAGENVDDPQQPKGSEDGSSGSSSTSIFSSSGTRSNHEKPNNSSKSLSRDQ